MPRIGEPIHLDGLVDEPAWESVDPLPVVMHTPVFGAEPSEKTIIRVGYDAQYLYIGAKLYDDPEGIQAHTLKRDVMNLNNDYLGVVLDTYNDNETALTFWTTPAGVRVDFALFDDAQGDFPANVSWDTFWDAEVARSDEGWSAELRIPFSSLRFQGEDGEVTIGLIAKRYIARKSEWVTFPAIPPRWGAWSSFKPSQAQKVVLNDVVSRSPLYITPYLLSGLGQNYVLNAPETAYRRHDDPAYDAGLDLKYGLTNNLTLDLTINTDFAQVEADDQQTNLTRFSLFFPEKRRFFQERSSLFDFGLGGPNRLFYSRRIGLHEGQEVRILGGARLVGRVGDWDLGALAMQTAREPLILLDGDALPAENFSVVRMRRQVLNPYSYAGGMVTSRIGLDGRYNVAYGLDGTLRLFGDDYLVLNWAQSFDDGIPARTLSLDPVRLRATWERRTVGSLGYSLSVSRSGPLYNPGLGFEVRENYTRIGDLLSYGWFSGEASPVLWHRASLSASAFLRNEDGSLESYEVGPVYDVTFKSGATLSAAALASQEDIRQSFQLSRDVDVPAGSYTFYHSRASLTTPRSGLFYTSVSANVGSFYDGRRISLSGSPAWAASRYLEVSGYYGFNHLTFPERDQQLVTHVGRLRLQATLTPAFSAAAFVQYNSAVDAVFTNFRVRYNPREGNDLYLVYNEGFNMNRSRLDPVLPLTSSRTLIAKYTHTLRW